MYGGNEYNITILYTNNYIMINYITVRVLVINISNHISIIIILLLYYY